MTMDDEGSAHPYIPNTPQDVAVMLARLGLGSTAELFAALPEAHRDPIIVLPPALSEPELLRLMRSLAGENRQSQDRPSFLGAGAYRHSIPSIVPYLVCELTGLDASNTGLYDVASATAEGCLLAARATERRALALLEPLHPNTIDVVRTYCFGANIRVDIVHAATEVTTEHACIVVQQPDFLGTITDVEAIAATAHAAGALCVVAADPFALGLLRAPGDAGADVVTGEGRDLAIGLVSGGPSVGLFAVREQFLRQMPGRIVGRTKELHGPRQADGSEGEPRTGYVLTLQAREQFIRRERATSNISTGQSLIALAFTIAVQALGPRGLRDAATLAYQRAHEAAARIGGIPGFEVPERGSWFCEFLVRGPLPAADLQARLAARGIEGGYDVSDRAEEAARDALLFCVTEATAPEHIDALIEALIAIGDEQ